MNNYPTWINPYAYNPQMPTAQNNYQQANPMNLPKTSVKSVTGIDGANAYLMAPDSSDLLLDKTGAVIYLVTTDSAGFKTVKAFSISPIEEQPKIDFSDIETRLARLEETVNAKSDNGGSRSKKSE